MPILDEDQAKPPQKEESKVLSEGQQMLIGFGIMAVFGTLSWLCYFLGLATVYMIIIPCVFLLLATFALNRSGYL